MMSKSREEAVWQRVMAMSAEAPVAEPTRMGRQVQPAQELTGEQVLELLKGELNDACTYSALANRTRGEARRYLQQLARAEQQHSRKLETVYYLMTGHKPCPDRPKPPCVACLSEELRKCYEEEAKGAARYHKLADRAGSFAQIFHCLGLEEEHHGRMVLRLLEMCL